MCSHTVDLLLRQYERLDDILIYDKETDESIDIYIHTDR